jgi:glycerol kinase
MAGDLILIIDAGTTSTRAMLFAPDGACLGSAQQEIAQSYPQPGWVEHDPEEIWNRSLACARQMTERAGGADRLAGIGITNQRETIVFWSRSSGRALAPAIVWQDRRTADLCAGWRDQGLEPDIQARTGLLLDPYFSASKIAWALDHWPELRNAGSDLAVGTVESWLVFKLSRGLHVTDASNASRTMLMDVRSGAWDGFLLDLFGVSVAVLPEVVDCAGDFGWTDPDALGGQVRLAGMAGDQQAAAIGQGCLSPGETKATFGTGAFVLTHAGANMPVSKHRLLSTIAWRLDGKVAYALEGSIFVAGSLVKWLRDELGLLATAAESAGVAASVPDSHGVFLVPGHSGLGAPHWQPEARGAIHGLSLGSGRAHIVRAALEAMAHQTDDLMRAFASDGAPWQRLRIDGGMATNDWMAQDLADFLGLPVERPDFVETTALGAAMLARVGVGQCSSLAEAAGMRGPVTLFSPAMSDSVRSARREGWEAALAAVLSPLAKLEKAT